MNSKPVEQVSAYTPQGQYNHADLAESASLKNEQVLNAEIDFTKNICKEQHRIEKTLNTAATRLARPGKSGLGILTIKVEHQLAIKDDDSDAANHAMHYNIFKVRAILIDLLRIIFADLVISLTKDNKASENRKNLTAIYDELYSNKITHLEGKKVCESLLNSGLLTATLKLQVQICLTSFQTIDLREKRTALPSPKFDVKRYKNYRKTNLVDLPGETKTSTSQPFRDHRDYFSSVDTSKEETAKDDILKREEIPFRKEVRKYSDITIGQLGLQDGTLFLPGLQIMHVTFSLINLPVPKTRVEKLLSEYKKQVDDGEDYLLLKLTHVLNDEIRGIVAETICGHFGFYKAFPSICADMVRPILPKAKELCPGNVNKKDMLTSERALIICKELIEIDSVKIRPISLTKLESCRWQYDSVEMFKASRTSDVIANLMEDALTTKPPPTGLTLIRPAGTESMTALLGPVPHPATQSSFETDSEKHEYIIDYSDSDDEIYGDGSWSSTDTESDSEDEPPMEELPPPPSISQNLEHSMSISAKKIPVRAKLSPWLKNSSFYAPKLSPKLSPKLAPNSAPRGVRFHPSTWRPEKQ